MATIRASKLFLIGLISAALVGIGLRFINITDSQFVFYDEGMYLDYHIDFLYHLEKNPPKSVSQLGHYLSIAAHLSVANTKVLWFFISFLRGFFFGPEAWFFTRVVSAIFGSLTLGVIYLFAKKYYHSKWAGLLSLALLAVLPSHVFYSRLGLQEALSAFCFLSGFYFYFFPRKVNYRTFLSGVLFGAVFFTNYRMIVLPLVIGLCELGLCLVYKEKFNVRKFLYTTLTFLLIVFGIGNIDHGANTNIAFAWMFYQAHLARGQFDFLNLLAYPYYVFRLESLLFGLLFFANIYYVIKKEWKKVLLFAIVCFQMVLFSFVKEQGARYMCVVMPFMAMAAATVLMDIFCAARTSRKKAAVISLMVVLFTWHLVKSVEIMSFRSDYQSAMVDARRINKSAAVLSTQPLIQKMFAAKREYVTDVPRSLKSFVGLYSKGYRYLMVDPQAYISYTDSRESFRLPLVGYLQFIQSNVAPVKTYKHFSPALLERFVYEHSDSLRKSMAFLAENKDGSLGALRVYDIGMCIAIIKQGLNSIGQTHAL